MTIKQKVKATIAAANSTTGKTDTDMTAAVQSLIDGYGQGGGEPAHPVSAGVEFIDYDGTLIASWPTAEVAGKTALPSNPDHSSDIKWGGHTIALTSQGWNWTLADIKSFVAGHSDRILTVGQMYKPTDNKLHLLVRLPDGRLNPASRFSFTGTATIDWGDGTTPTAAVSNADNAHTYAAPGDYDVAISISNGGTLDISGNSSRGGTLFVKPNEATGTNNRVYQTCIRSVIIPDSMTSIGNSAFYYCYGLSSVTIPDSVASLGSSSVFYHCYGLSSVTLPGRVTSIGANTFYNCNSLQSVAMPNSVTSIGVYAFDACYSISNITIPDGVTSISNATIYGCYNIQSVTIPDSVTSIGNSAFSYCYGLSSIIIPSKVTSIGGSAFNNCYGLSVIRFRSTTPPTVANANAWSNVPTDCIIYVPAASLNAYKSATNYPSPSTYTYIGY